MSRHDFFWDGAPLCRLSLLWGGVIVLSTDSSLFGSYFVEADAAPTPTFLGLCKCRRCYCLFDFIVGHRVDRFFSDRRCAGARGNVGGLVVLGGSSLFIRWVCNKFGTRRTE